MSESAEFELPTQEDFRCDLRALCLGAIRLTLEMLLDEEVRTLVGAGRWQRLVGRKDVRNGSYLRRLVTSMGLVELEVPRAREGGSAGEVLGRYRRRTAEIDDAITAAYVHGVSTRKMGAVTEALMGERVSRSALPLPRRHLPRRALGAHGGERLRAGGLRRRSGRATESCSGSPSAARSRKRAGRSCSPSSSSAVSVASGW